MYHHSFITRSRNTTDKIRIYRVSLKEEAKDGLGFPTKLRTVQKNMLRNVIFCGHTHQTLYKKDMNIEFYNSGCWTDIPSSYIVIDNEGNPEILYMDQ